jgi:hypothetical protein
VRSGGSKTNQPNRQGGLPGWLPILVLVGVLGTFVVVRYSGILDNHDADGTLSQVGKARIVRVVPPYRIKSGWAPGVLYLSFAGGDHTVRIDGPALALALQELQTVSVTYRVGKSGRVYVDGLASDPPLPINTTVLHR